LDVLKSIKAEQRRCAGHGTRSHKPSRAAAVTGARRIRFDDVRSQSKPRDTGSAKDRSVVVRGWPEAGPDRLDFHFLAGRQRAVHAFEQRQFRPPVIAALNPASSIKSDPTISGRRFGGEMNLLGPDHARQRAGLFVAFSASA
jgi:hypothetical protein